MRSTAILAIAAVAFAAVKRIEFIPQSLSLTLANLGGVCESVLHSMPDMARNFYTIPVWPGHERNLMDPYFAAHGGDGIAEGQDGFWIPSSSSGLELS